MTYLVSEAQQSIGHPGWEYLGPVEMTRDDLLAEFAEQGLDIDPDAEFLYVKQMAFGQRWVKWVPA